MRKSALLLYSCHVTRNILPVGKRGYETPLLLYSCHVTRSILPVGERIGDSSTAL